MLQDFKAVAGLPSEMHRHRLVSTPGDKSPQPGQDGRVNNRLLIIAGLSLLAILTILAATLGSAGWFILAAVVVALLILGIWDMTQRRHAILRNLSLIHI